MGSAARKCPVSVHAHFESEAEAIAAWNRRTAAASTAEPVADCLKPPFEIYHDKTNIGDQNGHVCGAENPEIAEALIARLNHTHAPDRAAVWRDDISAKRISEIAAEGDGLWRTCTGCHNTIDGHDDGFYPISKTLGCKIGSGCRECGGLGAVWDDTDYAAMGEALSREPVPASEPLATPSATAQVVTRDELVRVIGSFPTHTDDRGDEGSVLHDAFSGDYTERTSQLYALTDRILSLLPSLEEVGRLREALEVYEDALAEAEAIFGGEYADNYGPMFELAMKARDARAALSQKEG